VKVTLSPKALEYVKREAKYLKSGRPRAAQQFSDDLKRLRQGLRSRRCAFNNANHRRNCFSVRMIDTHRE
jgi:plasmid stabilization system protein ParE